MYLGTTYTTCIIHYCNCAQVKKKYVHVCIASSLKIARIPARVFRVEFSLSGRRYFYRQRKLGRQGIFFASLKTACHAG
jgi:hypothetical protein